VLILNERDQIHVVLASDDATFGSLHSGMSYVVVGHGKRIGCSSVSKCSRGARCVRLCRRSP
jgi:hypothetical protein